MSLDLNQDLIIITDPPCVVVATMPPSPPPFPPSPPPLPELVDISVSEPGSNQVIVIRANSPYNITGETRMKIMIPDKEKGGLVCVCVCVCVRVCCCYCCFWEAYCSQSIRREWAGLWKKS